MTDKTAEQIKAEQLKDAETLVTADKLEKGTQSEGAQSAARERIKRSSGAHGESSRRPRGSSRRARTPPAQTSPWSRSRSPSRNGRSANRNGSPREGLR